jgi:hypothetical protein
VSGESSTSHLEVSSSHGHLSASSIAMMLAQGVPSRLRPQQPHCRLELRSSATVKVAWVPSQELRHLFLGWVATLTQHLRAPADLGVSAAMGRRGERLFPSPRQPRLGCPGPLGCWVPQPMGLGMFTCTLTLRCACCAQEAHHVFCCRTESQAECPARHTREAQAETTATCELLLMCPLSPPLKPPGIAAPGHSGHGSRAEGLWC